jgi:DNA ligase-associated metallophosphoesterase
VRAADAPPGAAPITLAGERLHLLPERAVWWPATATLFVADLHLGKGAHFRARGLPVPHGTTGDTLDRLSLLLQRHAVRTLVVLGDFVHAADALAAPRLPALQAWRAAHAEVAITLVAGNHDRPVAHWPAGLALQVAPEPHPLPASALLAAHHPQPVPGHAVLAGHLHPAVMLQGPGGDRLRLPCFAVRDDLLVLPAFGAFTGASARGLPAGARAYAVTPTLVRAVPHDGNS